MSTVRFLPPARCAVLAGIVLSFAASASPVQVVAQTAQPQALLRPVPQVNRVSAQADFSERTTLAHHLPGWVHVAAQTAQPVDLSQNVALTIVLRRDDAVQAAFEQLLADQQNPSSPMYHQWLTPQQVGAFFGPTDADLQAVTGWLQSEGLSVDAVQPNRVLIDVSGPAAKVASAFRTQFAYFALNGQTRFSAAGDPSIPAALMPVISGIGGLTEVRHAPASHVRLGQAPAASAAGLVRPNLTATSNGNILYFLAPADFNVIYDITSVLNGGNKGATIGSAPQHIAIIGRSRVDSTDVANFESLTGIGSIQPNYVLAGTDPGLTRDVNEDEATLDFDRVAGTAPGAVPDMIIAKSTNLQDGVYIASAYNVNTLKDPIMTLSFGACEADAGSADSSTYRTLFSAGAAEGISIFVSSGDSGADGCFSAGSSATTGIPSANDLCNDYTTCVGGTEFVEGGGSYWSSSNNTGYLSALSYIPEGAWNEPTETSSSGVTVYVMAATGGGPSAFIGRPSWQTGTGVPTGAFRETPDISFTAAGHDGYFACLNYVGATCTTDNNGRFLFVYFNGTSASAPSMAAITALLNTKLGKAQGLLNPLLYRLANTPSAASAFHDVTVATSGVGTCSTGTASLCNNSTPTCSNPNANPACTSGSLNAAVVGYAVGVGYDDATGLGSLDVANFLTAAAVTTIQTTLAVTATPNPVPVNTSVALKATLTPATTGTNAPTGTVTFYANGAQIGSPAAIASNQATLNYTFTTAGTYAITATYSGDSAYGTSTATAFSLVVSNAFTISAATTSFGATTTVVSGSTLTDNLTLTSVAPFTGVVGLTCAVAASSSAQADVQAAAGASCSVAPSPVTLTSGGTGSSVLTIRTTPGTSGSSNVVVTGTSGANTSISPTVTVKLTASSFTITNPTPATLSLLGGASSGNTSQLTVTSVNGFVGTVSFTCTATPSGVGSASANFSGTCAATPVTLTSGGTATTTVTATTTAGSYGVLNLVVTGTGTTAGATLSAASACGSSTQPCIAVTVNPPFTLSAAGPLTIASGATTGNTENITVTAATGFSGTVNLSCALSTSSAAYQPSCAVAPTSVSLTSGSSATAVVTISSHAPVTQGTVSGVQLAGLWLGGGLASLLGAFALRRRRVLRSLALAALLTCGFGMLSGCGGGSSPKATLSSAGSYTATVTGTSGSTTITTTFSVTIQ